MPFIRIFFILANLFSLSIYTVCQLHPHTTILITFIQCSQFFGHRANRIKQKISIRKKKHYKKNPFFIPKLVESTSQMLLLLLFFLSLQHYFLLSDVVAHTVLTKIPSIYIVAKNSRYLSDIETCYFLQHLFFFVFLLAN